MKFKNLIIPLGIVSFGSQRKCGPGLVMLGSIGASLLGTGATIASQAATNSSNKRFAADESEKARQWESDQWQNRFEQQSDFAYDYSRFQTKQAYDIWLGQQQYNSPAYQAQRMLQAGFNPAAVGASPTYGSTGLSPAPASPPSPAVATPQPLMSQAQNPVAVSDIGNFIKDVAQATKDNTMLQPMFENLVADTENKQLIGSYQKILNNMQAQKAPAEIQKAFEEVNRIKVEIAMMQSQKGLYDEEAINKGFERLEIKSRELLNYFLSDKASAETSLILLDVESYWDRLDAKLRTMKSEQVRNFGIGAQGYSQAELNKKLGNFYESVISLNQDEHAANMFNRLIRGYDLEGKPYSYAQFAKEQEAYSKGLDRVIWDSDIAFYKKEQASQIAQQMTKATNYYEFNMLCGQFCNLLGAASSMKIAGAMEKNAGSYGQFVSGQIEHLNKVDARADNAPSVTIDDGKGYIMDKDGLIFRNEWNR